MGSWHTIYLPQLFGYGTRVPFGLPPQMPPEGAGVVVCSVVVDSGLVLGSLVDVFGVVEGSVVVEGSLVVEDSEVVDGLGVVDASEVVEISGVEEGLGVVEVSGVVDGSAVVEGSGVMDEPGLVVESVVWSLAVVEPGQLGVVGSAGFAVVPTWQLASEASIHLRNSGLNSSPSSQSYAAAIGRSHLMYLEQSLG